MKNEWFADWFDSPYYHTLYKSRDENEAQIFIENLSANLQLPAGSRVLDLACGKGRHSVTLQQLGYQVLGADLSLNSISFARQFENEQLKFVVHDMREVIKDQQFAAVFNLFTSFGYFDSLKENKKVMTAVAEMLQPKGLFIIDFMNVDYVVAQLVKKQTKVVDGIEFKIERALIDDTIVKDIRFSAEGKNFKFQEKVQAIRLADFEAMLEEHNFKIIRTFGDFQLKPFDLKNSSRLIIIAQLN
ncbi:MAG: class I SAM-dependent methyltransferase [Bacteroidota bacterium]